MPRNLSNTTATTNVILAIVRGIVLVLSLPSLFLEHVDLNGQRQSELL